MKYQIIFTFFDEDIQTLIVLYIRGFNALVCDTIIFRNYTFRFSVLTVFFYESVNACFFDLTKIKFYSSYFTF